MNAGNYKRCPFTGMETEYYTGVCNSECALWMNKTCAFVTIANFLEEISEGKTVKKMEE